MRAPAVALRNARVVLADGVRHATLHIEDGIVRDIADAEPSAAPAIDCENDLLIPGLIELHTDNLERHLEPRPGTSWNAERAMLAHDAELAAAGITTAFESITLGNDLGASSPSARYLEQIDATRALLGGSLLRVDHRLHFRCELSSPLLGEHLERAGERGAPRLLSLMDHTPGQGQWADLARFRNHYARRYNLGQAQLEELIARRQQTRLRFAEANRAAALGFARRHGCVIASHDDTGEISVAEARKDGCSISEFPTTLEAARAARRAGMQVIAGAPNLVRGGSHSGNVSAATLVRAGACDMLSSDYYPPSLIQAVFTLAREFDVPLHAAVATATLAPAGALALSDRGSIAAGKRADLVRVRETAHGPVVVSVWCAGRPVA